MTAQPTYSSLSQIFNVVRDLFRGRLSVLLAAIIFSTSTSVAFPEDIESFTEPYRTIEVAAAEVGVLAELYVKEGDQVEKGQILASLDQAVLRASLEITREAKDARGQLNSALADLRLRADRFDKLLQLRQSDHASQEEVERAATEKEISEGRVLTAHESLKIKNLEFERIKAQLERRLIRSPINGVITHIIRDVGEFVAHTSPVVLTVVQLDPLMATFSVPSDIALRLLRGQSVQIMLSTKKTSIRGTVDFISPVTDPQSGNVRICVLLRNSGREYRSGEKCSLLISKTRTKVTRKP
jgi:RND family efflux transporter MFP subunit